MKSLNIVSRALSIEYGAKLWVGRSVHDSFFKNWTELEKQYAQTELVI
jgi:hypothetical protein